MITFLTTAVFQPEIRSRKYIFANLTFSLPNAHIFVTSDTMIFTPSEKKKYISYNYKLTM